MRRRGDYRPSELGPRGGWLLLIAIVVALTVLISFVGTFLGHLMP